MNSKINMRIRHNRKARSTSGYAELTRQITGERKSKKERNKHMPWTLTDKHFIAGLVEEGCAVSEGVMITTITIRPRLLFEYDLKSANTGCP